MKKRTILLLISVLVFGKLNAFNAQTLRPGVLVVGNTDAAAIAALQSAISGVKTILLVQSATFDLELKPYNFSSGLGAKLLLKAKKVDNLKEEDRFELTRDNAESILTDWMTTTKNLTVIKNVAWEKADHAGNNWVFKLGDNRTIRPNILICVGENRLSQALKIGPNAPADKVGKDVSPDWSKLDYSNTRYRTSIAAGKVESFGNASYFSYHQFINPLQENLIYISDTHNMLVGQAAGATAAGAAFFGKKLSEGNPKTMQGELINYKLSLMPFDDVKYTDTNWRAIQLVGLTGVLKGEVAGGSAKFMPDQLVTTEEIRQPMKDYFYKAQIWFDDYKDDKMTIQATIEMACYVGNKSLNDTKRKIEKAWKTSFQFKNDLNYDRQINRREFAVILQEFCPPFNVNVDKDGKVLR